MFITNNWNLIRLFLAVVVMVGHLQLGHPITRFIQGTLCLKFADGNFAVRAFFAISGFLITSSFLMDQDLYSYFKKRILRIYPPIVITVIILLITALFIDNFSTVSTYYSIASFLLFQDWLPLVVDHEVTPYQYAFGPLYVHGAFWTLVVEMQFYIILPILVHIYLKKTKLFYCIILVMYVFSIIMSNAIAHFSGVNVVIFRQSFIVYSSFFITGMLLKIHFQYIAKYKYLFFLLSAFFFVDYYYLHIAITRSVSNVLYPIYLSIFVVCCAVFVPSLKSKYSIPDISYGMYIYHYPIFGLLFGLGVNKIHSNSIQASIILSTCVIASLLSYYFVEKKCIRYGKVKN